MATAQSVLKTFMSTLTKQTQSLKGKTLTDAQLHTNLTAALDKAVKASGYANGLDALITQLIADCTDYNNTYGYDGWEYFLADKCDINLDNRDTGAITGADAGGKVIKSPESVVPETGSLIKTEAQSFTRRGLTFTLEKNFKTLTAKQQFIWQALYTWWADGALDLIEKSYGYTFTDSRATYKNITVKFVTDLNDTDYAWVQSYGGKQVESTSATLTVNMRYYNDIDESNPNGFGDSADFYLDKTLAHELTHALMYAEVPGSYNFPAFIKEGMAELTIGIDDERTASFKTAAENPSLLQEYLDVDKIRTTSGGYDYTSGYIFFRYLAKQLSTLGKSEVNRTANKSVVGTANNDTLENYAGNVTLSGKGGNDSLASYSAGSKVTIDGGDGADQIYTHSPFSSINTGADDDFVYLNSKATNSTVTATNGNNEIYSLTNTALITAGSGNDYIELFNRAEKHTVHAAGGNDSIYSGAQTASIVGGAGNDYIELYPKATANTVKGGSGDDVIMSYNTNGVVYQYGAGDGNDSLVGFSAKDTLIIGGGSGTYSTVKNNSNTIITVGDGKLTIVGGANLNIKGKLVTVGGTGKNISNSKSNTIITATNYSDTIYNSASRVTIDALGGDDSISNRTSGVSISGGVGNDSIYNDHLSGDNTRVTILGGDGNDSISNFAPNVIVYANADKDTVYNGSDGVKVTLSGGAGNDYLDNRGANVSISAGVDNDTVYSAAAKVTILGGKGNDSLRNVNGANVLFQYTSGDGNDIITGFNATSTLSVAGGTYSTAKSSGDIIVTVGDGKVTLSGAASLSTVNIKGTLTGGGSEKISLTNSATSPYTLNDSVKIVDASSRTRAIQIAGNTLNNSIVGGSANDIIYGRAGDDTLWGNAGNDSLFGGEGDDILSGGAGNDTLKGGNGSDRFVYSAGLDVIFDYATEDVIKFAGTNYSSARAVNGNVVFSVGNGSLTVNNAVGKNLTVMDSTGSTRSITVS